MKIKEVKTVIAKRPIVVRNCVVGKGYLQGESGSLPDVDIDFQSDRRQEVKEYLERRYNINGLQRVFSAGTFTTMKLKAVLKDVARVHGVPVHEVNYITAIIDDDSMSWSEFFQLAFQKRKLKDFIQKYPKVIEDIRTLMGQPRSASVHASAIIITPEYKDGKQMECFDYLPIKKIDDMLVSEIDGYSIDEIGLLKNDCLGIKELTKLQNTRDLVIKEYGDTTEFLDIINNKLDDEKAYQLFTRGFTQNIFQFGSSGMTKFVMDMKPTQITDLIAANALFRPATIETGSTEAYVKCKNGEIEPEYLWGTYDILKETFAQLTYQEDLARMAREIGGFSLAEGVHLVKFISKKKVDKILQMKDKFLTGAKSKGCPDDQAEAIWKMFESAGTYLFNKSHATAYALTAYIGAWYKANYPTAFYTIALQYAKDENITSLMSEMELASNCKIVSPDINQSGLEFITDFKTDEIYWSLLRIKFVGAETVKYILEERDENGLFLSLEDFCNRLLAKKTLKLLPNEKERCPVNSRHIKNLIISGCFDKVEKIKSVTERYAILLKASKILKFSLSEKDFPESSVRQHYFWSMLQISMSGIGSIDYERTYHNSQIKHRIKNQSYKTLFDCQDMSMDGKRCVICASVVDYEEKGYKDKETGDRKVFAKVALQQNNDLMELILWNDDYERWRSKIQISKDRIIIASVLVRWSDFSNTNTLTVYKSSVIEIL